MKTSQQQQKPRNRLIATIGTAIALGLAAPTFADGAVGPDIAVYYGDLAIEKEQGASSLLKRIENAARRVCARLDHGDLASRANARACISQVTDASVHKVNHPMLLAIYNSRREVVSPVASLVR